MSKMIVILKYVSKYYFHSSFWRLRVFEFRFLKLLIYEKIQPLILSLDHTISVLSEDWKFCNSFTEKLLICIVQVQ